MNISPGLIIDVLNQYNNFTDKSDIALNLGITLADVNIAIKIYWEDYPDNIDTILKVNKGKKH